MVETTLTFNGMVLTFDAVVSEVDTLTNTVTEHEVESVAGAAAGSIVDHVKRKPRILAIEGVFSGSPFVAPEDLPLTPSAARFQLEWIYENALLVTVTTPDKSYDNMVLESLSVPRNRSTGDSLQFSAQFRQVRFAVLKESFVRVTRVAKVKPKIAQGTKPTVEVTSPTLEDAEGKSPLAVGGITQALQRQQDRYRRSAGRVRGVP
jgi:hypothetical protein